MGHRSYLLNGRVHNAIVRSFGKIVTEMLKKKNEQLSEFLLSRTCGSKDPYFGRYFGIFFDNCFENFLRILEF